MNFPLISRKVLGVKVDNLPDWAPGIFVVYVDGEVNALVTSKSMANVIPALVRQSAHPERLIALHDGKLSFKVLYRQDIYDKAALQAMKQKITLIGINDFTKL